MTVQEIWLGVPLHRQQEKLDQGYTLQPHASGPRRTEYVMAIRDAPYKGKIMECIDQSAAIFGIPKEEILGRARRQFLVRWAAMWAARRLGRSTVQIGYRFNRDHTTVMHAERRCEEEQAKDPEYRLACERLLRMVKEAA